MPPRKLSSLEAWLVRVDPLGSFDKYLPQLEDNFDCAEQIVDAYVLFDGKAGCRRLDKRIFEDIGVQDEKDQKSLEAWFVREIGIEPLAPLKRVERTPSNFGSNKSSGPTHHEAWLNRIDCSGRLEAYLPALQQNFDCAEQVIEAYTEEIKPSGQVVLDPQIFADMGVTDEVAKCIISDWFAEADSMQGLMRRVRGEGPLLPFKEVTAGPGPRTDRQLDMSETTAGRAPSEETSANSTDENVQPAGAVLPWSRVGMAQSEEVLRRWCASAGIPEEVLVRLHDEDVWSPEDLVYLEKQDLADIVRGLKKGVQGRFYSAVYELRKAKGLDP